MIDDIYNSKILECAAHIDKIGRLDNPDATAKKNSRLCGSTVTVDLIVVNGIVVDFAHEVRACALGQASSSLMAKHIIGSTTESLKALRETVWAMLVDDGNVPTGQYAEFACLQPIKDYKARHASTMLTFDAVVDCINQIDESQNAIKSA
ncbi:iron-sulfur cluster assembly scaffold protein [Bartonella sp. LJL80]